MQQKCSPVRGSPRLQQGNCFPRLVHSIGKVQRVPEYLALVVFRHAPATIATTSLAKAKFDKPVTFVVFLLC
jgi:hypothetical protein